MERKYGGFLKLFFSPLLLSSSYVIWPNFSSFLVFCYFHLGTILVILEIETRTLSYKEKV